jgi:uncharacterized protein YcfJ
MKHSIVLIAATTTLLTFSGCQTKTQTGLLTGAALGAGAGALIDGGSGTVIGGAIGAIGGGLIGSALDAQDRESMRRRHPDTLDRIDYNQQLTVSDIIKMSRAGLSDATIISMIQKTDSRYHLDLDAIKRLERNGVSQEVINYMISN